MVRRQGPGRAILVALVALLGGMLASPGASATELRKLLVTHVTWVDAANNTGTWLFQGTMDAAGNLTGRVYPGDGTELVVNGGVAGDGILIGTLDTTEDALVGTFAGQLNAQRELEGELAVDGEATCGWAAPADALAAD